jgi:CheY-like chemotaxis protein
MSSLHVLLIDGNSHDRRFYVRVLETASPDYVIYEAASGLDGLRLFFSRRVDCVVLELELPDMSGFGVLAELSSFGQRIEIPVIILTRLDFLSLRELALLNGAANGFCKSIDAADLLHTAILEATSTIRKVQRTPGLTTASSTLTQLA